MDFKDAAQLSKVIERRFRAHRRLFDRMDADYRDWRMEPFVPNKEEGIDAEDAYTSNTLRTLADKIESYISHAQRIVRVPNQAGNAQQRQANNALEMLATGMLEQADELLMTRAGAPPVQAQGAWFTTVRGAYAAARFLLLKDEFGETVPDILPIDPRHFVIQWGGREPLWAAIRIFKDRATLMEEFPNFRFGDEEVKEAKTYDAGEDVEEVIDCYYRKDNRYYNGVIIDERWARKPEELFCTSFPIKAVPVGNMPIIAPGDFSPTGQADSTPIETIEDFGESVFAPLRDVMKIKNRILTYRVALTAKAVKRSVKVFSTDGEKTLTENPNLTNNEINLSTANNEEVELMEVAQTTRDTDTLLERITDDETDGGLPPQAFGILPAPISSLALKQLGNNLEHKVQPRLKAIQTMLRSGLDAMVSQYETGLYQPIRVHGKTFKRQAFDQFIPYEMIQGHGRLEVILTPVFPEEEIANWNIAQIATAQTASGEPLASVQWVRDNVLKMQDRDMVSDENMLTMARMSDPMGRALEAWKAAVKDGNMELAAIWYDELQRLNIMKQVATVQAQLQLQQGIMMGGRPNDPLAGMNSAAPVGNRPEARPAAAEPGFTPEPSQEAGFNTTSPRENSENAQQSAIGLNGRY